MKRLTTVLLCVCLILLMSAPVSAVDYNLGKCTANLSSAVSNSYTVNWYNFMSPYSPYTTNLQEPSKILGLTSDNSVTLKMDYQLRDDSMVKGQSQAANMQIWHWNPSSYSWTSEGSVGQSKGSSKYSRYNLQGVLTKMTWWGSSSKVVKYKVQADAKSGSTITKYRYLWIVRTPGNASDAYKAGPRWMVSRYDRSALYYELGNNWQALGSSPTGSSFKNGMDEIIRLGSGFIMPTKTDLAVAVGLDAIGIINTAWVGSSTIAEATTPAGVIYQGFSWVMTANNLLGQGLKDSIVAATKPLMIKNAASGYSSLTSSLKSVANAARDEADALQAVLYSNGSVSNWEAKLAAEQTAIDNALTAINGTNGSGGARNSVNTYCNGFATWSSVPGVGSADAAAAEQARIYLNQYLDGIQNQLNFDKALIDKACSQ